MFDKRLARFFAEHCPTVLDQLKRHEGTRREAGRHVAYRCPAGAWTIGWGHNLDANPVDGLGPGSTLSDAQAEALLSRDVARIAAELDLRLPWWRRLGPARAAVVLDMAFNLGVSGLLGFERMLGAARRGRFEEAAAEMLDSRWAGQVGVRAVELAEQMREGRWSTGGTAHAKGNRKAAGKGHAGGAGEVSSGKSTEFCGSCAGSDPCGGHWGGAA